MSFFDVQFQSEVQRRLQRALQAGCLSHAHIFAGPEGVGKGMLAERLAALLLCGSPVRSTQDVSVTGDAIERMDACGKCVDCTLMSAGNHPDFHAIHRFLNKLHPDRAVQKRKAIELSVDVIRHFLIGATQLQPSRGRAKVFVVAEAHLLSIQAQNALLKTLEEPPSGSYLILLTPSPDALLPTTRSRCQLTEFRALPKTFVAEQLMQRIGLAAEQAQYLAELSGGSLGSALAYAGLKLHEQTAELMRLTQAAAGDALGVSGAFQNWAKKLADEIAAAGSETEEEGEEFEQPEEVEPVKAADADASKVNATRDAQATLIVMIATLLRDLQRALVGLPPAAHGQAAVARLSQGLRLSGLRRAIRGVGEAQWQLRQNAGAALVFDKIGILLGRLGGG